MEMNGKVWTMRRLDRIMDSLEVELRGTENEPYSKRVYQTQSLIRTYMNYQADVSNITHFDLMDNNIIIVYYKDTVCRYVFDPVSMTITRSLPGF